MFMYFLLGSTCLHSSFGGAQLSVTIKQPTGTDYSLELDLAFPTVPSQSNYTVFGTKIEIKLHKAEVGLRWPDLESSGAPITTVLAPMASAPAPVASAAASKPVYPSSSKKHKNWDQLESEAKKEEAEEKPEGDAALNALFKQIYSNGSDEQRRAMIKSYVCPSQSFFVPLKTAPLRPSPAAPPLAPTGAKSVSSLWKSSLRRAWWPRNTANSVYLGENVAYKAKHTHTKKKTLELVADRNPVVAEVVAACKNLQVTTWNRKKKKIIYSRGKNILITIRHKLFDEFVDLLGLLALATTLGKDDIGADRAATAWRVLALFPHEARLLGVLQIVPVSLCESSIDRLFDPVDAIDVSIFFFPLLLWHTHAYRRDGATYV